MLKRPGIYIVGLILLVVIFSLHMASPPPVRASVNDTSFSVDLAYKHLLKIARAPHSIGTEEHARVRQYIDSTCKQLGLTTTIQHTTTIGSFRGNNTVFAGNINNVIARIKGKNQSGASKAVLIGAHYDSHPNTLGAGDDGAGVAAMLEVARILKRSVPLENDVIFLFTDGEEIGLVGAKAFIEESGLINEIGLVLNFEARGSAGVSNMFEVNNDNGWIINHFIKSAAYPFANSLSFEVYKLLPNDTDFTLFKKAGISGLNHAFIERLEDYHSMTDNPEHLDKRSLQHHGANMLSLVKHFGNTNLSKTKDADLTYFNIIGSWIISYPSFLNIVLVLLNSGLYLIFLIWGIRTKHITLTGFIASAVLFPVILCILIFTAWLIQKGIYAAYPLNGHFYEHNAYNGPWYFLAITAAIAGFFSFIYQWLAKKITITSLYAGILLIAVVLMMTLYLLMPTATYLLGFPLIFSMAGSLFIFHKNIREHDSWKFGFFSLGFSLPAVLLFAPVIYMIFVAFGLGALMPAVSILIGLFLGLLLPVLSPLFQTNKLFLPLFSIVLFVLAMAIAHFNADFTKRKPLQTNLWYHLNADKGEAWWLSAFKGTDDFNRRFLAGGEVLVNGKFSDAKLRKSAPPLAIEPPIVSLLKDTAEGENRKLRFHCSSKRDAISMTVRVNTGSPLLRFAVDGKNTTIMPGQRSTEYSIQYYGLTKNGFELVVELNGNSPLTITAIDRSMGLPPFPGVAYPPNIIPGAGRNSNTTQVSKTFIF